MAEITIQTITDSLKPKQKARLHEVADLMLEIYRELARMRYLDPDWIEAGPHDISALMPFYLSLNLDPSIIYLYSILPNLSAGRGTHLDWYGGSTFIDFRDKSEVEDTRLQWYSDDPKGLFRPWMTSLSCMRNHRLALFYDAKRHYVGIFDDAAIGSSDPNIHQGHVFKGWDEHGNEYFYKEEDGKRKPCDASEWDKVQQEGSEDSDEEEDEYEEEEEEEDGDDDDEDQDEDEDEDDDENYWDEIDARRAGDVLRDIIRWYHELAEIPGNGENQSRVWDREFVKPLLLKHGWPSKEFDGDAFVADQKRAVIAEQTKDRAEAPLHELASLRHQLEWYREKEASTVLQRQGRLAAAKTVDEEWLVRWEMWDEERRTRNRQLKMERTEQLIGPDTGLCHNFGDLPFWDWKQVRNKLDGEKRELEQLQQERPRTEQGTSPNPQIRKRICEAEKRVAVYEMAYAASLADVERLRPGQETVELDLRARAADLTIGILDAQQEVEEIRGWIGRLPEGADQARKLAQERVDRWEDAITHMMKSRQCCVESMDKWTREPED